MEDSDHLHRLRHLYYKIYAWHKENGERRYREKFSDNLKPSDAYFQRYLAFLEGIPDPEQADFEVIHETAKEVLCGCMEWSYGETVAPETPMARIAKEILSELEEVHSEQQDQANEEQLRSLRNLGKASLEPRIIEVSIPDGFDLRKAEHYERLAMLAYSDLQKQPKSSSLGGYVTLADCNLERELNAHGLKSRARTIRFRNSAALHLKTSIAENSIAALIDDGAIAVESLTIGRSK